MRPPLSLSNLASANALHTAINAYLSGYENETEDFYYDNADTLGTPKFLIFASCWTLFFVIYLYLTSSTAHKRNDRPIGRFFNRKIVYAVDFLSAIFWFAGFIGLALYYQASPCGYDEAAVCDTMIISILVGVCLWYCFSPCHLRESIDKLAGSPSLQQASWQRVTCFAPAMNVPRSTPVGSIFGFYSASATII